MHLKESAYNFIYDDLGKDQIVFYNSRTGALAVVHEDQYKGIRGFRRKEKKLRMRVPQESFENADICFQQKWTRSS